MLSNEQTTPVKLGSQLFSVTSDLINEDDIITILPIPPSVINGTEKNDKLRGTAVADTINGLGSDDNLYGEGGNDTLNGGDGNDYLTGGVGVDTFNGGPGVDTVYFSDETAAVEVDLSKGIATQFVANRTQITETLNSIERITGTDFDDLIIGDDQINTLIGGDGDDTIKGRGGGDRLVGGNGNDTLQGDAGNDVMNGGLGRDSFDGGVGSDLVNFSREEAGIEVDLNEGIARLMTVDSTPFTEDLVSVERVVGTAFDDTLIGDDQINTLSGGDGDDTIDGGGGGDRLVGGNGNDSVFGGDGNDDIDAGLGIDAINGGDGSDMIRFSQEEAGVEVNLVEGKARVLIATSCPINGIINKQTRDSHFDDRGLGGPGLDLIDLGGGCDRVFGFENLVSIERASGTRFDDVFIGNDAINTFSGGDGNDTLEGGAGGDRLSGGNDNDSLSGGDGNDELDGGLGIDTIDGGTGSDVVTFRQEKTGVEVDLAQGIAWAMTAEGKSLTATLTNVERATGTRFDDLLIGDDQNNSLYGGGGNDTINGGGGDDKINGGLGIDRIDGGEGTDSAHFSGQESGVAVNLAENTVTYDVMGKTPTVVPLLNIEMVYGSGFDDLIIGNEANNRLSGGDGNDTILGGAGNDRLFDGEGIDYLDGGAGRDSVYFGQHKSGIVVNLLQNTYTTTTEDGSLAQESIFNVERVIGTGYADAIVGSAENEALFGNGGNDILWGGDGNDGLFGGTGIDNIDGGNGIDTVYFNQENSGVKVDLSKAQATVVLEGGALGIETIRNIERVSGSLYDDVIIGDSENNRLLGASGNDTIHGGNGNDELAGSFDDDVLSGDAGDDLLRGGDGNDILNGGAGRDRLIGGANADTFVFESLDGNRDTILDFVALDGDRIQVSAAGFGGDLTVGMLAADQFVLGSAAQTAQQRFIYDQSTGALAFDVDGSGAQTAVQFASLSAGTSLTSNDFLIA